MQVDILAVEVCYPTRALLTDAPVEILNFAADMFDSGIGVALVTLVEVTGGAARAVGSQMAVGADGRFCGFVSGGCTEAAVAAEAIEAIAHGQDRLMRIGEGSRMFDIVLPCGGGITLTIHVLRESGTLRQVALRLRDRKRAQFAYYPGQQRIVCTGPGTDTGWTKEGFVRAYRPDPRVILYGQSIETARTASVSRAVGYDTICLEMPLGEAFRDLIDQDTAVVLLHHDIELELPVLRAALARTPFYIGALGSVRTHGKRRDLLSRLGYGELDIARIKAPIGIFGKARDARTLALSVVGDVAAAYGGSLHA